MPRLVLNLLSVAGRPRTCDSPFSVRLKTEHHHDWQQTVILLFYARFLHPHVLSS